MLDIMKYKNKIANPKASLKVVNYGSTMSTMDVYRVELHYNNTEKTKIFTNNKFLQRFQNFSKNVYEIKWKTNLKNVTVVKK